MDHFIEITCHFLLVVPKTPMSVGHQRSVTDERADLKGPYRGVRR